MNVSLTPELEELIRRKVESGMYGSASEVVREALRLLEERDQDRLARLKAAIAVAEAQVARGEGIPYTSTLFEEIRHEVEERLSREEQPDPDVCP
jgi:antitoxin ParD1/3/4